MLRTWLVVATFVATAQPSLAPSLAWAQPSIAGGELDASNRATARRLSEEALEHFRAERWQEALAGFDEAQKLLEVPTLATFSARCLVKLGRLVEASERYRRAIAFVVDPSLTPTQQEGQRASQSEAQAERAALLPRIPTLTVETDRAPGSADEVRLDGVAIPRGQLGVARLVDPGKHRVSLVRGGREIDGQDVTLAEGATQKARLAVGTPPPEPPVGPPPAPSPVAPARPARARDGTLTILGWTGVGAGATSLAVAGITFASAAGIDSDLAGQCSGDVCPPRLQDQVDEYDALRTTALLTFVGGVVLAGAGVTILVVAPDAPAPTARAQVRVSARNATFSLRF